MNFLEDLKAIQEMHSKSSFLEDLKSVQDDEDLNDITLITSDNENVRASRYVLAMRSKVFRKMLFGKFRESKAAEINIDFPAHVVRNLVDYCFSNEVSEVKNLWNKKKIEPGVIYELLDLLQAAHFFEMEGLQCDVEGTIGYLMTEHSEQIIKVACSVPNDDGELSNLFRLTQCLLQSDLERLLTMELLEDISPRDIHKVINMTTSHGNEEYCLLRLEEWATKSDEHKSAAKKVVGALRLENLYPVSFARLYDEGSLISDSLAFRIFRAQAIKYHLERSQKKPKKRKR